MISKLSYGTAAAAAVVLMGCASIQEFAMTPEERAQQAARAPAKCSAGDNRTWDLGTGGALEVRRKAPGFWALRDEGWVPANQPLTMADQDREAVGLTKRNHLRMESLDLAKGISRPSVRVGDMSVVDLVPDGRVPYQFRAISNDDKTVSILATAGECPRVVAHSTCEGETLRTAVRVEGTVRCVGSYSVTGDYIEIASDEGDHHAKLTFGEILTMPAARRSLSVLIFAPNSKVPIGRVTREIDDFSDPVPDEVLAMLRVGKEAVAAKLFEGLADRFRTTDLEQKIAALRVNRAEATRAQPATLAKHLNGLVFGVMPGDKDVLGVFAKLLPAITDAEPSSSNIQLAAKIAGLCAEYGVQRPGLSSMEAKYGPLLITTL